MSDVEATPVTLGQAMSMVEAWPEGFGFQLHRIARTLYEEVCRLQADPATRLTEKEDQTLVALTDEPGLQAVIDQRDQLQKSVFWLQDEVNRLEEGRDKLKVDYAKLDFQTRAMGVSLADKPDGYGTPLDGMPLTRVLDLMDGWRDGVECWGLHQMCRRLREAYEVSGAKFRVAPGEPFETDYLADSGFIHLFEPRDPKFPRRCLFSAGCVRLIEPTLRDDTFDDDLWIGALNLTYYI